MGAILIIVPCLKYRFRGGLETEGVTPVCCLPPTPSKSHTTQHSRDSSLQPIPPPDHRWGSPTAAETASTGAPHMLWWPWQWWNEQLDSSSNN